MRKRTHWMMTTGAAIAVTLSQNAAIVAQTKPAANSSVRATTGQIRTSIGGMLGWHVGIDSSVFRSNTFVEAATLADALGLAVIAGDSTQKVSPQIPKNLEYHLSPEETAVVKDHLASLRLKMTAYRVDSIPSGDDARKLFAFAKDFGVQTIIVNTVPSSLTAVDKLASDSGLTVAIEDHGDPARVIGAIGSASSHIGVSGDTAMWLEHSLRPVDALGITKGRLLAVRIRDRNSLGSGAHDVKLGTGAASLQKFFLRLAEMAPPPEEKPESCVNCSRPYGGIRPLFLAIDADPWQIVIASGPQAGSSGGIFNDLWQAANDLEAVVRPAMAYRVEQDVKLIPPTKTDRIPADVKEKIVAALPKAVVTPNRPRKLLIVDVAPTGAYYHDTAAHANFAIQKMADRTGAFEAIFSNDLNNLKYPNILKYDAVFLNSGDGPVFADPDVLNGLARFVREGGGVAGLHGASYASMDIREFGDLIGAQTGPHKVEDAVLKLDDPNSPITKPLLTSPITASYSGKAFNYRDEFYHFLPDGPYSREKLHVLISIDADKSDLTPWQIRPDRDYGLVWIKNYGQGRVFNCAFGHTPTLFETQALSQMILNAIQFVLGDLPADTTPSASLAARK